ncbi:MAG: tRNA pseudouridine(38-40) synthase TruA [Gammaproteobacteria bacterium]|nr:tRNA pseudouridine(38-40) synthase TruA [Gammaproteobacteria bacterium]
MRIALGVEYDGASFYGWQHQDGVRTVQDCVEQAISNVADHPVKVTCAGRTDTGVHALNQVIHFDSEVIREDRSWVYGTNANLPQDVAIVWARQVDDEFNARFSAIRRRYRYVIFNRQIRPTFLAKRVCWDYRALDIQLMRQAAEYLTGEHNFNSYRAQACQANNPIRTLYGLNIQKIDDLVIIDVEANAFLQHMIRNIAGVLMTIGAGEKRPVWAKDVLDARDRTAGGVTASPNGLYFIDVKYPETFDLPRLSETRMVW